MGALSIYIYNNVFSVIDFNSGWTFPHTIPTMSPAGMDYQAVYKGSQMLAKNGDPYQEPRYTYPPLVSVLYLPLSFLPFTLAYKIQIVLIYALTLGTLYSSIVLARKTVAAEHLRDSPGLPLSETVVGAAVLLICITSYPFLFSLERGNYDILPMAFILAFLFLNLQDSNHLWAETVLLCIAVNLKLYPMIGFAILAWKYKWRSLAPFIIINLALLLMTGMTNAVTFVELMPKYIREPSIWIGNHSITAFIAQRINVLPLASEYNHILAILIKICPLLLWTIAASGLFYKGRTVATVLLLFLVSVPVMEVVPSTSHDYKLIIIYSTVLLFLLMLLTNLLSSKLWLRCLYATAVMVILGCISQSYVLVELMFRNKYPYVVFLQFIFVMATFSHLINRNCVSKSKQTVEVSSTDSAIRHEATEKHQE
jgi:hypothetical protein